MRGGVGALGRVCVVEGVHLFPRQAHSQTAFGTLTQEEKRPRQCKNAELGCTARVHERQGGLRSWGRVAQKSILVKSLPDQRCDLTCEEARPRCGPGASLRPEAGLNCWLFKKK